MVESAENWLADNLTSALSRKYGTTDPAIVKDRYKPIKLVRGGGKWPPIIAGYYTVATEPHTIKGTGRYEKDYNLCWHGYTQKTA